MIETNSPRTSASTLNIPPDFQIKGAILSAKEVCQEVNAPRGDVEKRTKSLAKLAPFILMHIACVAVLFVGIGIPAAMLCVGLYAVRMFAVTAGYHRYFSHRSFKTNRVVQFLLALLGTTATQ